MRNYLKTKDDEIGCLKVMFRQSMIDGVVSHREIVYVRAMLRDYGISEDVCSEAEQDFHKNGFGKVNFSSKEAAAQAIMSAVTLSAVDLDFSESELLEIFRICDEIGISANDETISAVKEYVRAYLSSTKRIEAAFDRFYSEDDVNLKKALPTEDDKKGFIRVVLHMSYADGKLEDEENRYLQILGKAYFIDDELVEKAIAEFKEDPSKTVEFSNDKSMYYALKACLRMAVVDGEFSDAEQRKFRTFCDMAKAPLEDGLIEEIEDAIVEKEKADQLKDTAFETFLKNL